MNHKCLTKNKPPTQNCFKIIKIKNGLEEIPSRKSALAIIRQGLSAVWTELLNKEWERLFIRNGSLEFDCLQLIVLVTIYAGETAYALNKKQTGLFSCLFVLLYLYENSYLLFVIFPDPPTLVLGGELFLGREIMEDFGLTSDLLDFLVIFPFFSSEGDSV